MLGEGGGICVMCEALMERGGVKRGSVRSGAGAVEGLFVLLL